MMNRAVAVSDIKTIRRGDRRGDVSFGVAHRGLQILALSQAGGDGGGQRASGAVGVTARDARRGKRDHAVRGDEIVDALRALAVSAP